jgi:GTPase
MSKAAFVAIIGRPSAGKSTLVNKICGEKVSIVSAVPQTTRDAIRGICTREQGQLVFVDTPGRHKSEKKFNIKLSEISAKAVEDSDLVLYVLDSTRAPGPEETEIAALLSPHSGRTIAAINKIDDKNADPARAPYFHVQIIAAAIFCSLAYRDDRHRPRLSDLRPVAKSAGYPCLRCFRT